MPQDALFTEQLTPSAAALPLDATAARTPALDAAASQAARSRGIDAADVAALDQWKAEADEILARLARDRATVTSDDVWAAGLRPNPSGSSTALGARFVAAARAGLILKTDRVRQTAQVRSHGSPMTVWQSLMFDDVEAWGEPHGGAHRDVCPSCTCRQSGDTPS